MRADRRPLAALAATGLLVLAGCAGPAPDPVPTPTHVVLETFPPGEPSTNGVEHLSGTDVLRETIAAIDTQDGMTFTLEYRDAAGEGFDVDFAGRVGAARATIATSAGIIDLELGPRAGRAWGTGPVAAGYGLDDVPVCLSPDHAVFADWAFALDPGELVRALTERVTLRRGALTPGDPPTLDVILDAGDGTAGTLVVAAAGPALPVRLVLADETGSAVLDVTGWGDAGVEPPAGC